MIKHNYPASGLRPPAVLVTGGAGFIGSNLCNTLADKGYQVTAFDNLFLGKKENLSPKVKFFKGDVRKLSDLERAGKTFDYIVHLAGASSAPMFTDDLKGSYENNIMGFINILQYAREISCKKLLYASTSSIYGNNPTPLTEDQQIWPPNFYSATKYCMENTAHCYHKVHRDMEIIGFRFMSVYGLNEKHKGEFANLASQFSWDINANRSPIIYGDGTQQRDFTNVKDIVQAIILAMKSKKKFGSTIFNIGTNKAYNLNILVDKINKVMGKNIKPKQIVNPVKEGYVRKQLADISKIKKDLGFKPSVSLEDGLEEIAEDLKK